MEKWIDPFKKLFAQSKAKVATSTRKRVVDPEEAPKYSVSDEVVLLNRNISDLIGLDDDQMGITFRQIQDIAKVLIYEMFLSEADNLMLISLLKVIQNRGRSFLPLTATTQWTEALQFGLRIIQIDPAQAYTKDNLRFANPRAYDTGQAFKRLQAWGVRFKQEGLDMIITSGWEDLVGKLEKMMEEIGGANLVKLTCRHLKEHNFYSEKLQRYVFKWLNSFDPTRPPDVLPYAFILNLAAKHVGKAEQTEVPDLNGKLQYISDVTKTMFASKGLLRYSIFETQLLSPENIVRYCERLTTYDSVYALPQVDLNIEELTLESCFEWVKETAFESFCKFPIADYLRVSKFLLSSMKKAEIPLVIYRSDIIRHFKDQPIRGLDEILTTLSTEAADVNRGYVHFEDHEKINVASRPLIKLSATKFIVLEKGWVGGGFFQALITTLRTGRKSGHLKGDPDKLIGEQFEKMVKKFLNAKNVTFYSGKYNTNGIEGDCDIAIEAESAIILIEIKKKQFSAKARAGEVVHLLLDLASSLLSAQVQAMKTELLLRQNSSLELSSDGVTSRIELRGRPIERIAVTQYDFNSFQDRSFTERFLTVIHNNDLIFSGSTDPDIIKGGAFIANLSKELRRLRENLASLESRYLRDPFLDCWFLSFAQLSLLLEDVKNNEDFVKNVRRTKSVSLNSNNFYYEYSLFPKE